MTRRVVLTPAQVDAIRRLAPTTPQSEIGKRTGLPRSVLRRAIRELGVVTMPRAQAWALINSGRPRRKAYRHSIGGRMRAQLDALARCPT